MATRLRRVVGDGLSIADALGRQAIRADPELDERLDDVLGAFATELQIVIGVALVVGVAANEDMDAGVVVPAGDPDALGSALKDIITSPPPRTIARRKDWLTAHTREALAKRLFEVLSQLV